MNCWLLIEVLTTLFAKSLGIVVTGHWSLVERFGANLRWCLVGQSVTSPRYDHYGYKEQLHTLAKSGYRSGICRDTNTTRGSHVA